MAQTVTTPTDELPRSLPRGRRSTGPKNTRPRFLPLDGVWMCVLTAVSIGLSLFYRRHSVFALLGTAAAAGTVAVLYLLGWRAHSRAAGVIAALLLATDLLFVMQAPAGGMNTLFTFLTVTSLFAFVAGSSLAALALAAAATLVRPDGLLLGLVLLTLSFAQHRRRALWGMLLLFGIAGLGWAALIGLGHVRLSHMSIHPHAWLLTWLVSPVTVFIAWFLLPFCADLGDAARRARWLPLVLWTILYMVLETFLPFGHAQAILLPFLPLIYLLAAGGLARLLPHISGDLPIPALRYVIATLAVLSLIAIRTR